MSPHKQHPSETQVIKRWWNGTIAKGSAIAAIVVALPTAGLYGGHVIDIWNAPKDLLIHEGQIATIQKSDHGRDEKMIQIDERLKAIQERQNDQTESLRRIENQLSWEYGHPPSMASTNFTRNQ